MPLMGSHQRAGLSARKHSILIKKYLSASGVCMTQPENKDELSEEQRKKNAYSVIVALIAVVIIGISFVWHLWSALFPAPSP